MNGVRADIMHRSDDYRNQTEILGNAVFDGDVNSLPPPEGYSHLDYIRHSIIQIITDRHHHHITMTTTIIIPLLGMDAIAPPPRCRRSCPR